jgi:quinone-modifying oxidoreductase subunit QmoA
VVWSTGWQPYDMSKLTTLGSGLVPNVVSNMQMERLASNTGPTGGAIVRPTDKKAPQRIAFVQCAGSRDQNNLNYCSYICCMASLKQATYVRAQYPDAKIVIYYIDIRTPGRYDQFYQKVAADPNIELIKGKVAKIVDGSNHDPIATVENAITGIKSDERFDLIVLATGMQPSVAGTELPVAVPQDEEGFIVGGADKGIIAAGCANVPLDVTRSAQSGTGAALKAISTVVGR